MGRLPAVGGGRRAVVRRRASRARPGALDARDRPRGRRPLPGRALASRAPAALSATPARLACRDIDVEVAGRTLVRGLSIEAQGGEFIAVLGRNGVGKTLTLHTLAGLRA